MLNKVQQNVNSMLSQAKQITSHRQSHRYESPSPKQAAEIENYIQAILSAQLSKASSHKNIGVSKSSKKRSATQNQHYSQPIRSEKRIKTQNISPLLFRLQPSSPKYETLSLEPSESELLSTKVFGSKKPKSVKKQKQCNLPQIKATKKLSDIHKIQSSLEQRLQSINSLKQAKDYIHFKMCFISNFCPQQNCLRLRQKNGDSLTKYLKQSTGQKTTLQSIKKQFIEINKPQPWQMEAHQKLI